MVCNLVKLGTRDVQAHLSKLILFL